MAVQPATLAWVFISHASADLAKVRKVRNFIEERGGGPILFHLRALTSPDRFWPLIEEEIAARNFFLLCDREAARASSWVQRERAAVDAISRQRPIRVGNVSLDCDEIDFAQIERFLLNLRFYLVHPALIPPDTVFDALAEFGYGAIGAVGFSSEGLQYIGQGGQANVDLIDMMNHGARLGWLMVIMDDDMANSEAFVRALPLAQGGNAVFVAADSTVCLDRFRGMHGVLLVDGTDVLSDTIRMAAHRMLSGV